MGIEPLAVRHEESAEAVLNALDDLAFVDGVVLVDDSTEAGEGSLALLEDAHVVLTSESKLGLILEGKLVVKLNLVGVLVGELVLLSEVGLGVQVEEGLRKLRGLLHGNSHVLGLFLVTVEVGKLLQGLEKLSLELIHILDLGWAHSRSWGIVSFNLSLDCDGLLEDHVVVVVFLLFYYNKFEVFK